MSDDGEYVEVTWGEEVFSPVQYNSFRVGPYTRRTRIRDGETEEKAFERVYKQLEALAAKTFERKSKAFIAALREVGSAARG